MSSDEGGLTIISLAIQGSVLIEFDQVLTCIGKRLKDLTFKRNHLYVPLCDVTLDSLESREPQIILEILIVCNTC